MKKKILSAIPALLLCSTIAIAAPLPTDSTALETAKEFIWHPHLFAVTPLSSEVTKLQCEEMFAPYQSKMETSMEILKHPKHNQYCYIIGPQKVICQIEEEINVKVNNQMQKKQITASIYADYNNVSINFFVFKIEGLCAGKGLYIPTPKPAE